MLYKSKRRRKTKKVIILALIFFLTSVVLFEIQAIPFTAKCIRKQSKTISTRIISETVKDVLSELSVDLSSLSDVKYSDSGEVKSISANTVNINLLKAELTERIQQKLDRKNSCSFAMPLGSFTQLSLLSGIGPEIDINFNLTGSVNCKILSDFKSGGVNQTVHHITLIVNTDIIALAPELISKKN